MRRLNVYRSQRKDKNQSKKETLDNAHKFFKGREMIINAFENGIFPLPKEPQNEKWSDQEDLKSDNEFYTPKKTPRDMPDLESKEPAE